MSDLTVRLRMWARECEEQHAPAPWSQDMLKAADMILYLVEQWHIEADKVAILRAEAQRFREKYGE